MNFFPFVSVNINAMGSDIYYWQFFGMDFEVYPPIISPAPVLTNNTKAFLYRISFSWPTALYWSDLLKINFKFILLNPIGPKISTNTGKQVLGTDTGKSSNYNLELYFYYRSASSSDSAILGVLSYFFFSY